MQYYLIILSALFMGLSQHPINCGWLAWFSLIPFIKFIDESNSFKNKLYISILWGFIYHSTILYWMIFNLGTTKFLGLISLILSTIILLTNTALISCIYHIVSKNRFKKTYYSIPVIWVSIEYIRTFSALGFPWVSLSNSQVHYNILAQNVEFSGIYGITFWLVILNVILYELYKKINNKNLIKLFIVFMFPWTSGYYISNMQKPDMSEPINIVVTQPNIRLDEKRNPYKAYENLDKMIKTSMSKTDVNTDLVLFPESALSVNQLYTRQILDYIKEKILNGKTSLLTGLNYFEYQVNGERINHNSVIHLNSDNVIQSPDLYHKIKLVPLAEKIPLSSIFPSLKSINIGQANFESGREHKIFHINNYKIGGMICYESTFPQLNRKFVENGAELLIYFVNDGWYETAPEPQQHAKQSIYRAIEFRRPVVRCANTGISQFIDKKGNIIDQIELNKSGAILASVIPSSNMTFYAKHGDVFAIINMLILFILLALYLKRKE